MLQIKTPRGNIYYSEELIKNIVALSTLECNGVVGLANRNFKEDIGEVLKSNLNNGVKINLVDDKLNIHVFVVIKYGIKVSIIANDVIHRIKDAIGNFIDAPLNSIVVNVQGVMYEN